MRIDLGILVARFDEVQQTLETQIGTRVPTRPEGRGTFNVVPADVSLRATLRSPREDNAVHVSLSSDRPVKEPDDPEGPSLAPTRHPVGEHQASRPDRTSRPKTLAENLGPAVARAPVLPDTNLGPTRNPARPKPADRATRRCEIDPVSLEADRSHLARRAAPTEAEASPEDKTSRRLRRRRPRW